MKVLLDTNAYTALFRGHEGVAARIRGATDVLLSTVVAGELLSAFATAIDSRPIAKNWKPCADLLSFDRHFEHVDGLAWIQPDRAE